MIALTDAATKIVRQLLTTADAPHAGIRISASFGGCSGLDYAMSIEEEPADGDAVVEIGEARLFIDPFSQSLLQKTVVDFVDEDGGESGFAFINANAESGCSACAKGC